MQEVTIRIRFIRPCLGFAEKRLDDRRGVIYRMPRDGQGRVMFLASWWKAGMKYAASVSGLCYNRVHKIDWALPVDGLVGEWKRMLVQARSKKPRYALHEAFRPDTEVGINAVLPDGITIDEFTILLNLVGTYKGISPYQNEEETYGTFSVVSVMPTIRQKVPLAKSREENDARVDSSVGYVD